MSRHFIEAQKLNDNNGYRGESPYHDWLSRYNRLEPAQANPDSLEDTPTNKLWGEGIKPEIAELIIEKFMGPDGDFPILSKRENQAIKLYTAGLSVAEIAKRLCIKRQSVESHLNRAGKKLKRLYNSFSF